MPPEAGSVKRQAFTAGAHSPSDRRHRHRFRGDPPPDFLALTRVQDLQPRSGDQAHALPRARDLPPDPARHSPLLVSPRLPAMRAQECEYYNAWGRLTRWRSYRAYPEDHRNHRHGPAGNTGRDRCSGRLPGIRRGELPDRLDNLRGRRPPLTDGRHLDSASPGPQFSEGSEVGKALDYHLTEWRPHAGDFLKRLSRMGLTGNLNQPGLFGPHAATGCGRRIVVAEKMQYAVNQKESQLIGEGMAMVLRLAGSGLYGDDHISKRTRKWRCGTLRLRKGKDVGGTIVVQIYPIEASDGTIIDEEHGELIVRFSQDG